MHHARLVLLPTYLKPLQAIQFVACIWKAKSPGEAGRSVAGMTGFPGLVRHPVLGRQSRGQANLRSPLALASEAGECTRHSLPAGLRRAEACQSIAAKPDCVVRAYCNQVRSVLSQFSSRMLNTPPLLCPIHTEPSGPMASISLDSCIRSVVHTPPLNLCR